VKCRSRSLAVYNNEFILGSASVGSENNCETTKSLKNDRLYVPTATKKRDIIATRLLKTRSNFSKYVMVSVAVSSLSASNIHVLELGVKINGAYYRDVVLRQMLLPDIRSASGSEFFVFQQDSAPSHRAKDSSAAGSRDGRFYPTRCLAAKLTGPQPS